MAAMNASMNTMSVLPSHGSRSSSGVPGHSQLGSSFLGATFIVNSAKATNRPCAPRTCNVSALSQQPGMAHFKRDTGWKLRSRETVG